MQVSSEAVDPDLQKKYLRLQETLHRMGSVVVGLSGGVDSSLLALVARQCLGERALAVIGESATLPEREKRAAVELAKAIGIRYRVVRTEETDNLKFRENPANRCYFCKSELFTKLHEIAVQEGFDYVADGTNLDDLGDFRPGMQALEEQRVRSPLREAGFTKADVRALAKHLGLSTWDKPALACLSSRFPYGTRIDKEALLQVEQAEDVLWGLGFRNVRVRHYGHTARIEIEEGEIGRLLDADLRQRVVRELKEIGYTYVTLDLEGFRSGSMNEVLDTQVVAHSRA